MTACSFVPAATQMIYDMNLQSQLLGVTFECPPRALSEKPKIVRSPIEGKKLNSSEINRIFSASKASRKSLYYVDEALLKQIQPDVIFTQDTCDICQIDTACTEAVVASLEKRPLIIPLNPTNLQEVCQTAITIATALGQEASANRYLSALQTITESIQSRLLEHHRQPKKVMLIEWMEPIYNCGHWIPFQITRAGGTDMLSNPGGHSIATAWEEIVKYNPEMLVIAPCGFSVERTKKELHRLTRNPHWKTLQAVKSGQVHIADAALFTQPSASTLTDGIQLLAALLHPTLFTVPAHLREKFTSYQRQTSYVQA
jgi:iron complex transport system substrate-binding protein